MRRREFTDEHCYLISLLLDEIGTSARTPALTLERYPDTPEYVATVWTPVGTACATQRSGVGRGADSGR